MFFLDEAEVSKVKNGTGGFVSQLQELVNVDGMVRDLVPTPCPMSRTSASAQRKGWCSAHSNLLHVVCNSV